MKRRRFGLWVGVAVLVGAAAASHAQLAEPGSTFRVFLKDGQALASFGESALVGDRLVFTVVIGDAGASRTFQLVSLPVAEVDLTRTTRYAESMRAARYAATRGEAEYAAVTAEVARAVGQLTQIEDPKRRLALAEDAKRRLLGWSRANYSYRAADVHALAAVFDEVIAELRAAAGETQFSLDLMSGSVAPAFEPLLPAPTLRESIRLAIVAAGVADLGSERIALLRAAATVVDGAPAVEDLRDLRADLKSRLATELAGDAVYAEVAAGMLARAEAALRRGDVGAVLDVRRDVLERHRKLGSLRPHELSTLLTSLDVKLEAARAYRLALDHYAFVRRSRLDYERRVRWTMSGLDGVAPVLEALRDMRGTAFERLTLTHERLTAFAADLAGVKPPEDLSDVHATLVSAVHMAIEACERRRRAVISENLAYARDASSAAAGALLLSAQARTRLVTRLYPPKPKIDQ